jgi:regulator of sigma E protease
LVPPVPARPPASARPEAPARMRRVPAAAQKRKREAMSTVVTILLAILIFGLVIVFHEFGHFITAKLSGVQVNEFSIGMGPALCKKIFRGTQYSIRALPVGGYVAMEGEDSPESEGARPAAKPGDPAEDADEEPEEDLNPVPLEQRTGKPFNEVKLWKRFVIIAAGAIMNFILGYLVLLGIVGCDTSVITLKIYGFEDGAKCAATGLQAEDRILAINGRTCYVPEDISYELSRTKNYSADFTVLRNGEKVELSDVQFDTYTDKNGQTYMPPQIIVYSLKKTPGNVMKQAWNYERYYARIIFSTLIDLAKGRESINNLSGPVGIVAAIGQAASVDWKTLLNLLVLITVNLGIFNLLPFPALDGGKLVFLAIEGVTRRPVPAKVQEYVNLVGFILLFSLMLFATYNDIVRLVTGQMFS